MSRVVRVPFLAGPSRSQAARRAVVAAVLTALVVVLSACTPAASAHTRSRVASGTAGTSSTTTPATPPTTSVTGRGPLVVVGLGDSVMSGTACDCQPFIVRYAAALASRDHASSERVVNLGHSGLTVPGLTSQLGTAADQDALRAASVVVVTIGANDLVPLVDRWRDDACDDACVRDGVAGLADPLAVALRRVRTLAPDTARILVTTYWNVFEDGDVADGDYGAGFAQWSDDVTAAANTRICDAAQGIGATCVDLYRPFNGDGGKDPTPLLADDGDHPNSAGHALIARTLLEATPSGAP
ncbi:GDSL-type esterase/lipase family protein [Phycicoccus sp. Root563]|uniref:SGNH/GDSL hydrolase family protein n=1 Tax=Phycicoccus sp. Root563 TaxID=1736562 RepID=UPI0012F74A63|nr:GDSL-type esterase/lipase family protein [Phycicoccus sp. Root563]